MTLFGKKWKSKNRDKRKMWVEKANCELKKNIDILKQIAENDTDSEVRKLAEEKLIEYYYNIVDGKLIEYRGVSRNVRLPETITIIGKNAFRAKKITSITIPESVKKNRRRCI
ncbi:MAG: hypothetical protein ACLFR1_05930 [Spirochaetia bacterium]